MTCKGRNGYFRYGHHDVWMFRGEELFVQVYSKHKAGHAPIQFQGEPGELRAFFEDIIKQINEVRPGTRGAAIYLEVQP